MTTIKRPMLAASATEEDIKEAPRHPSFLGFREPWDMEP